MCVLGGATCMLRARAKTKPCVQCNWLPKDLTSEFRFEFAHVFLIFLFEITLLFFVEKPHFSVTLPALRQAQPYNEE